MSKKTIIVIIVILVGAYFFFQSGKTEAPTTQTPVSKTETKTTTTKGDVVVPQSVVTSPKDTSDVALDKDLSNIDAELNALGADSASVSTGLSDTPVPQAQ